MINWAKKKTLWLDLVVVLLQDLFFVFCLALQTLIQLNTDFCFFRFINPDRNDFPDIDTDIQDSRRDEVKDYLVRQYRHVASITTFLEFKDKGVVRDVARALNVPLSDVNKVLKLVDTWDEYCMSKTTHWFREKYPEIEKLGEQLRGRIRGTGIHAAGVVTSKDPIFRYAPLETRSSPGSDERIPVVAVNMEEAEKLV